MTINDVTEFLKSYDGTPIKLMEVCGTHTSVIAKSGIRGLISPKIKLLSGPGCPVCVTPEEYIDTLCELAYDPHTTIVSFGDMMKVRGNNTSLYEAKAIGAKVDIVYSPLDTLEKAKLNPSQKFIIAAVGFETTLPIYALMIKKITEQKIDNITFLTSLKMIVPALDFICSQQNQIDGFIAPGNVSAIIGSNAFHPLCNKYKKPFCVAGFTPPDILCAIYDSVKMLESGKSEVHNYYRGVVKPNGNAEALDLINQYFNSSDSNWRAIGQIQKSGLVIKDEYSYLCEDSKIQPNIKQKDRACSCSEVILGKLQPFECKLFGKVCSPKNPVGPCMVSSEGSCGIYFREGILS